MKLKIISLVLLLIPIYVSQAQGQYIEPELVGNFTYEEFSHPFYNNIAIDSNGLIYISMRSIIIRYSPHEKQFVKVADSYSSKFLLNGMPTNLRISFFEISVSPDNHLYIADTGSTGILTNDDIISLLTCGPAIDGCPSLGIRSYAFNSIGNTYISKNVFTEDRVHLGEAIYQYYGGTEVTLFAGLGDFDIEQLQIDDPPVNSLNARILGIRKMIFFNNTLFFDHNSGAKKIFKITPDGWISPITSGTSGRGIGLDFTAFSDNIILAERPVDGAVEHGVYFISPDFSEPILATVIPEINQFHVPHLGLAYDPSNDDLYVITLEIPNLIVLWKVPAISRVLTSHIPNWRHYE